MKPIIRVTIQGGVVGDVEYFPGSGEDAKENPIVQVWDYDCEGSGGNYLDSEGEEFNLGVWTPGIIGLKDLQCEEIPEEEEQTE